MRAALRATTIVLAMLGLATTGALAQTAPSIQVASTLTSLLDARGLDTFAAPEPGTTDRFVAVMYIKGAQLLVVSAKYPVPELLNARLDAGQFREAYMDLQGVTGTEGRWFFQDLAADGLRVIRENDAPFDIVFQNDANYVVLNGDWARQSMSEADYRKRFAAADERYAQLLATLAKVLRAQS